jgi:arylsulfatase
MPFPGGGRSSNAPAAVGNLNFQVPPAVPGAMNVLLVVLDTVRARNASLHGHANGTTPFLSSLAERATVYEQARAPAARSLDSHVSVFTGLGVEEHGVTRADRRLAPGTTVFDELRESGHATGVFTENSWLTDVDAGLRDPFETRVGPQNVPYPDAMDPTAFVVEAGQGRYVEFLRAALDSGGPRAVGRALANGAAVKVGSDYPGLLRYLPGEAGHSTPASVYVDRFLDWSAGHEEWAACLNLMDAHHPYEPAAEHDRWGGERLRGLQDDIEDVKWEFNGGHRPWWQRRALEGLYDGAIRQVDAELERLVTELERRGELDETFLVVCSDHGEGFGEPSRVRPGARVASHSVGAHEVLLHVPLLVRYPGQEAGRRVEEVASLVGFPDAVRGALDGDGPDATPFVPDGPVVATAHGLDDAVRERAARYCEDLTPYTATSRVVYEGAGTDVRKYVTWRDEAVEIRVRDAGTSFRVTPPGERDERAADRVAEAFERVEDHGVREGGSGVEDLDDDAYQHLEDLGYV